MTRYFSVFSDHIMTWFSRHFLTNIWQYIFDFFLTTLWRDYHVNYWSINDEIFFIFSDHVMTWLSRQVYWPINDEYILPFYDQNMTWFSRHLLTSKLMHIHMVICIITRDNMVSPFYVFLNIIQMKWNENPLSKWSTTKQQCSRQTGKQIKAH